MDSDIRIAEQFGIALANRDFVAAHAFLTGRATQIYLPENLEQEVAQMTLYAPGPILHVEVMQAIRDWPGRQQKDIAWVYVALTGDAFSEAVTVVLCSTPAGTRIRELEWGRP
jgi:hypothetical protein